MVTEIYALLCSVESNYLCTTDPSQVFEKKETQVMLTLKWNQLLLSNMERYRHWFCNGDDEDETHFLLSCKIYNELNY